jgi:hypothetical protein
MSLTIALVDKQDERPNEMNWLRNPYGLGPWMADSYEFFDQTRLDGNRSPMRYIFNDPRSLNASERDRERARAFFKQTVDDHIKMILAQQTWYFFFDVGNFMSLVLPHWDLIPKSNGKLVRMIGEESTRVDGGVFTRDGNKYGIPMEYFSRGAFHLFRPLVYNSLRQQYHAWMSNLANFAEHLQDLELEYYLSE